VPSQSCTGRSRRGIFGSGWEGRDEYTDEELEVLRAADAYRRAKGLRFLSVTDILKVMKGLDYRKHLVELDPSDVLSLDGVI
jgi:hypothetical protein